MADSAPIVMFWLHIANLLVSAYLLKYLFDGFLSKSSGSFAKTTKIMLVAVLVFFVVEMVQVFRFFSEAESQFIQSFFSLLFLILLISVSREMRQSSLAHDHLMRRKLRMKMSDVD